MMMLLVDTVPNLIWTRRADAVWKTMLEETLQRGFHGTVSLELQIADGTIQWITRNVKRVEKQPGKENT